MTTKSEFRYPRRRLMRGFFQPLSKLLLALLTDLHIEGREHFPKSGPLIIVANHFAFLDPVMLVRACPYPIEFLGGLVNPGAPPITKIIPNLWGYYPVIRGTGSRYALHAAEAVLGQQGALVIMPEGGSWAQVLRPARPGTAYIAARTGAPILPIGLDGVPEVFARLRQGKRQRITVKVGEPFGPFHVTGRGRDRREQLEEIGHEIMRRIAPLIPAARRGFYSDDPAIREAAKGTEIYPWADRTEHDYEAGGNWEA